MAERNFTPFVFTPTINGMVMMSCNTTSNNVALGSGLQIRLFNQGPDICHITFGVNNSIVATSNSFALVANTVEMLTIPNLPTVPATYLAAVSDSSNNILSISTGWGI